MKSAKGVSGPRPAGRTGRIKTAVEPATDSGSEDRSAHLEAIREHAEADPADDDDAPEANELGLDDDLESPADGQRRRYAHMFDPWLTTTNILPKAIGDNLIGAWHAIDAGRQRKIREADRDNRDAIIRAVIANLAYVSAMRLDPPAVGIVLRASKQKAKPRYDRPGFTGLPRIVELLSRHILTVSRSERHGQASAIVGEPRFAETIRSIRFRPDDFQQMPARESIWLSATKRDNFGNLRGRELIDYADTEATIRYRAEMERINATLGTANITVLPLDDRAAAPVPTRLRTLRRVFNLLPDSPPGTEQFDLGGRLFGGWWQGLEKERRRDIRINGEPVADLDFQSMFLRLAYVAAGVEPPRGDLYAGIPGLTDSRYRRGVKKVASAMLFRTTPLTRVPRGTRSELPGRWSGADLRAAILAAHPALAGVFETGIGLHLMFQESRILVAALLALADQGIPALPMHDGLMVARSKLDAAEEAMGAAAETITGHRLPLAEIAVYPSH